MSIGPFVEDLSVFFSMSQDQATVDGVTATVVFDRHDDDILNGVGQSTLHLMMFRADDFPDLHHGDAITVNDEDYQVQVINLMPADGAIKQARLFKV